MRKFLILLTLVGALVQGRAQEMSPLHVEGRWLCDTLGNHVTLHGFGQTYSPWFNEQGRKWTNYDVAACLSYNKKLIDAILANGWKMDWLRLHMDPYWSNTPGQSTTGENDISAFSVTRFKTYLDQVFIPMAEYANKKGLYVVMRPPGVCPERIAIGDEYQKYLMQVWGIVASHEKLKNNPYIMFELANEPINILGTDGQYTSWSDGSNQNMTKFFQAVVDSIRSCGAENILWVPGLGYQSQYAGYAKYPIKGDNIGYAVHCYPGWYGSDSEADGGSVEQGVVTKGAGYAEFQAGWSNQVGPIAKLAPILVTEMDWAPQRYNSSWGKATTGVAGGVGFGANFKYIMDKTGNVSWMLFTGPELLARYNDYAKDGSTFLTDPEACPRPIYRWFKEYADPEWRFEDTLALKTLYFPETDTGLNPNVWETGTFDAGSGCLITGQWGFGGWQFGTGLDLSAWKYLVIKLKKAPESNDWSFRMFDENSYWTTCYQNDFHKQTTIIVRLQSMYRTINGSVSSTKVNPAHIYIAGFWSPGNTPLYIDKLYLTNRSDYGEEVDTGIDQLCEEKALANGIFDLNGRCVSPDQFVPNQIYVNGKRKIILR